VIEFANRLPDGRERIEAAAEALDIAVGELVRAAMPHVNKGNPDAAHFAALLLKHREGGEWPRHS
jgi:hypothetical protein